MKHILSSIMLAVLLVGCGTTSELVKPEAKIIKQTEYVIKIPPAELMTLPPPVAKIDIDKALQSDIAAWLLANESRTKRLEDLLIGIAKFFVTEENKLKDQAATFNIEQFQAQADAATTKAHSALESKIK